MHFSAGSKLDVALDLLEKQELLLVNLQKKFCETAAPLSVLTCYNIEQDNMLRYNYRKCIKNKFSLSVVYQQVLCFRMSACISKKQNEIDDLKQRNSSLEVIIFIRISNIRT